MIKRIVSVLLLLFVYVCSFCQQDKAGVFSVGFKYYKATDGTRSYNVGKDTVARPMLIHFWYPCESTTEQRCMSFRDYIDLIAIREDFAKEEDDINKASEGFINAYLGFAKQKFGIDTSITTTEVLNSPVKARYNARPANGIFPLIIYAPSNSKSAVQNHIMCESLAENGFMVISVGSAGEKSLKREDEILATMAQVADMEFLVRFIKEILHTDYSGIGLLGYSSGGPATVMYQMKEPEVKAVISLDGSQEYSSYLKLYKMEGFDPAKADMPYLVFANNYKNFSLYPYYNSIPSEDKHMYRMSCLDHNGFISYWKQFDMCGGDENVNPVAGSYDILCEHVTAFFNETLKSVMSYFNVSESLNPQLIGADTVDCSIVCDLLNHILKNGIESAVLEMRSNAGLYEDKDNLINILGRMFIGVDESVALKIFVINTEINPDSWKSYYNLAYLYKRNNDLASAMTAIKRAAEINAGNSDIKSLYDEIENAGASR